MKQTYIIPEWFWEEKKVKEWLSLIPEETRRIWEDAKFAAPAEMDLDRTCTLSSCMSGFFKWSITPQGHDYWETIVNFLRKLEGAWRKLNMATHPIVFDTEASKLDAVFKKDRLPSLSSKPVENKNDCSFDILGI